MNEVESLKDEIAKLTIQANEDMITILRLRSGLEEEKLATGRLLTEINKEHADDSYFH